MVRRLAMSRDDTLSIDARFQYLSQGGIDARLRPLLSHSCYSVSAGN